MGEIRRMREELGWSMSRLAREAGVTPAAVRKWERDGVERMRLGCALRVAAALGCSVEELAGGPCGTRDSDDAACLGRRR